MTLNDHIWQHIIHKISELSTNIITVPRKGKYPRAVSLCFSENAQITDKHTPQ